MATLAVSSAAEAPVLVHYFLPRHGDYRQHSPRALPRVPAPMSLRKTLPALLPRFGPAVAVLALVLAGSAIATTAVVETVGGSPRPPQAVQTPLPSVPALGAAIESAASSLPVPDGSETVSRARSAPEAAGTTLVIVNDHGVAYNRRFYAERLGLAGWTLVEDTAQDDSARLMFQRRAEKTEIMISRNERGRTVVIATIAQG